MREKSWKVLWTFGTTTEAMAMETRCRQTGIPGRLIPLPRQISAGCGMAWMAQAGTEAAQVDRAVSSCGLTVEGRYELLL